MEKGQRDSLRAEKDESERWREGKDRNRREGKRDREKYVCSQLLQPLGNGRKGERESHKTTALSAGDGSDAGLQPTLNMPSHRSRSRGGYHKKKHIILVFYCKESITGRA